MTSYVHRAVTFTLNVGGPLLHLNVTFSSVQSMLLSLSDIVMSAQKQRKRKEKNISQVFFHFENLGNQTEHEFAI